MLKASINQTIFRRFMASCKGPIQSIIENKLSKFFSPSYLAVVNESYKHSVPKGSESHFKVVVVSEEFKGKSLIQKHRSVNQALSEELKIIHALAIQAHTEEQWLKKGGKIEPTPNCLGGSKFEQK